MGVGFVLERTLRQETDAPSAVTSSGGEQFPARRAPADGGLGRLGNAHTDWSGSPVRELLLAHQHKSKMERLADEETFSEKAWTPPLPRDTQRGEVARIEGGRKDLETGEGHQESVFLRGK
jgi:hypothetical protein